MKPFLGIDVTDNKKNEEFNGEEFIVEKPSLAMVNALEASMDESLDLIERSELPFIVTIVQMICGGAAILIVLSFVKALGEVGSVKAFHNGAALLVAAIVCAMVWLVIKIIEKKREKNVLDNDEAERTIAKTDTLSKEIYAELNIPADAQTVDILSFSYKMKDGKMKVHQKGTDLAPYVNLEYDIFADSENLYLANLEGKCRFPLHALCGIRRVDKGIYVPFWNKETEPNKGEYKQFKLRIDDYGRVYFKAYYVLEFEHEGELWGIYFPNYELPIFEKWTGLTAG